MGVGCGIGSILKLGNEVSKYEVVGFCLRVKLYKIQLYVL